MNIKQEGRFKEFNLTQTREINQVTYGRPTASSGKAPNNN